MICTKCGENPTAYGGLCIECEVAAPGEPENIDEALEKWVQGETDRELEDGNENR
jgi:hypothetical protein